MQYPSKKEDPILAIENIIKLAWTYVDVKAMEMQEVARGRLTGDCSSIAESITLPIGGL